MKYYYFFIMLCLGLLLPELAYCDYVERMIETDAIKLRDDGGRYEGYSYNHNPPGWWVQYRKVKRISHIATDPSTGQKWYDVYFSEVIPQPGNLGNHDTRYLSQDQQWLWVPEGSAPPWKWATSGSEQWVLKAGYPQYNPNNVQLVQTNAYSKTEASIYGAGMGITYTEWNLQSGQVAVHWYFRLTYDMLVPSTLNPGDQITIPLHADASGQAMNNHHGFTLSLYHSGFDKTCDPPTGSFREPYVFAGRAGNGTLILKDDRKCWFTVPNNAQNTLSLSFYAGGWGTIVTYVWEKKVVQ